MPCALGVTRSESAGSLTSSRLSRHRLGHERILVLERSTGETVSAGPLRESTLLLSGADRLSEV